MSFSKMAAYGPVIRSGMRATDLKHMLFAYPLVSCEAHHVGISPEEDCGSTAFEVGEAEGSEEEVRIRPNRFRFS
jgi:hypothetical protein